MAQHLIRNTGLGGAIVIGLGSILGTGAYVSVGMGAAIAGDALLWAILIAAFTALCNGLSSAQLAAAHPVSGGTYEYGYRFLNPASGVFAGVLFIVAKAASAATAALAIAWYLVATFLPGAPSGLVNLFAGAILLVFTLCVLSGVRRTTRLNIVLVAVSLSGLLMFVVTAFNQPALLPVPQPGSALSVFEAAALLFVAFTGYGRIATMGEEITAPKRNIPRAVIITLIVVSSLYATIGLAILHLGGLADFSGQNFSLARLVADASGNWLIVTGGIVAMSGVVLNLILGVSRVVLAMGRRGDLPRRFSRLDAAHKAAPAATWVTFAIMVIIASLGTLQMAWTLSAFTVLVYYGITNLAALQVGKKKRFIPKAISIVGLLSCTGLIVLAALASWIG